MKPRDEQQLKLDRARWWVLQCPDKKIVFYGQMCMRLSDVIAADDAITATAATDGQKIWWHRPWLENLDDEETRFVLLHETLHNAHFHPWRLPADEEGNQAGDYAINRVLQGVDGIRMPAGGLLDSRYDNLAEEEILAKLRRRPKSKGGQGQGPAGMPKNDPCGAFMPAGQGSNTAPKESPATANLQAEIKQQWERAVIQAAQQANKKDRGDLPADLLRELERLQARPIDWRRELADFVKTAIGTRNDWSRSARRHAWQPVIYPRRHVDQVGTIIFARDTSGSVSDKTQALYASCVSDAIAETKCGALIIDCDARIHQEIRLAPGEPCPLKAKGGGGTNFRPVFDRARELMESGEQISGVIYLTDLCGPAGDDPGIPTLWIATENLPAPFGNVVHVEDVTD